MARVGMKLQRAGRLMPTMIRAACLMLVGLLVGCTSAGGLIPQTETLGKNAKFLQKLSGDPADLPRELAKSLHPDYVLEPGDIVLVQPVDFDSPLQLPADQPILMDGTIGLGQFGRLVVAGQTLAQFEKSVESVIQKDIDKRKKDDQTNAFGQKIEADVTVRLIEQRSKLVYVLGEVNAPGSYALLGRETVLDALILAGGLTDDASRLNIILSRPTPACGCRVVLPVCYQEITQVGNTSTNYQIQPGDRLIVPGKTTWEKLFPKWTKKPCPCKGDALPCPLPPLRCPSCGTGACGGCDSCGANGGPDGGCFGGPTCVKTGQRPSRAVEPLTPTVEVLGAQELPIGPVVTHRQHLSESQPEIIEMLEDSDAVRVKHSEPARLPTQVPTQLPTKRVPRELQRIETIPPTSQSTGWTDEAGNSVVVEEMPAGSGELVMVDDPLMQNLQSDLPVAVQSVVPASARPRRWTWKNPFAELGKSSPRCQTTTVYRPVNTPISPELAARQTSNQALPQNVQRRLNQAVSLAPPSAELSDRSSFQLARLVQPSPRPGTNRPARSAVSSHDMDGLSRIDTILPTRPPQVEMPDTWQ